MRARPLIAVSSVLMLNEKRVHLAPLINGLDRPVAIQQTFSTVSDSAGMYERERKEGGQGM